MAQFPANDIISLVGGAPRYDLAESVGPDLHLAELTETAADLGAMPLSYGSAAGDPRLREAIAAAHGVSADDVVTTMGGMHALFLLAFILCDRGGEAVTTSPLFPLARNALDAVGADVRVLPLTFDAGYRLDPAALRVLLTPATRLVSLASPQNPSGVAIPPDTLRAVIADMQERCPKAFLLVDETYREAAYGDDPVAESAVALSPRVIAVSSLSKCHGAPGLRLGFAVTRDKGLREQLVRGKFNTVISCSPLDEALALRVLAQQDRIIGARRKHLGEGVARTAAWAAAANRDLVDWVWPDAGALSCLRLRPAVFDDAAIGRFRRALASEQVRLADGGWFGDEARVFRLGFGLLSTADLEIALARLTVALRRAAQAAA
jgi:aspartate/methionine/tyrosine aminotransferase